MRIQSTNGFSSQVKSKIDNNKYLISTAKHPSGIWETVIFKVNFLGLSNPNNPLRIKRFDTYEDAEKEHSWCEEAVEILSIGKWNNTADKDIIFTKKAFSSQQDKEENKMPEKNSQPLLRVPMPNGTVMYPRLSKNTQGEWKLKNPDYWAAMLQTPTSKQPSKTPTKPSDDHFIAYDNGTVLDTKTNLMWAAKDNGNNINWANAKSYCENYRGGGYTDWRMPTLYELTELLYDADKSYKSKQKNYDVHLTELIQLSDFCVWASDTYDSEAATFEFIGGAQYLGNQSFDGHLRALPVRSVR